MPTSPMSSPLESKTSSAARTLSLNTQADRMLVRSGARSTRYALVTILAPTALRSSTRIPVNLAIVLDRSGSMGGQKFLLARRAVELALAQLQPEDRFALVVYDDNIDVLAESTRATSEAKRSALARLASIEPRGSTDLSGGWMRGCEQIAFGMAGGDRAQTIDRCLLLTDGLANRGITDRDELNGHASALRDRGIQTSTFGVGEDFDERLLAGLADAGGGHFYFLSNADQIPELIASEVGEALEVVRRSVVVEATLAHGMTGRALSRYRSHTTESESGRATLSVDVGDLVSGQEVELVISLNFPTGTDGETIATEMRVVDATGSSQASARLQFAYASHADNDRQPRNREVDRRVAAMFAARARREAVEHQRAHEYDRARGVLIATARRISDYAGGDAELLAIGEELQRDVTAHKNAPMPAPELKERYFRSYNAEMSRAPSGKANKQG